MNNSVLNLTLGACLIATASFTLQARTLNVELKNGVTYCYDAGRANNALFESTFIDNSYIHQICVDGIYYNLSQVNQISVAEESVEDNNVSIVYSPNGTQVYVAGNLAQYLTVVISNNNVTISQSSAISDTVIGEITYTASGSATNASLTLQGEYKSTVVLNGVQLTSASGPALNLENGKRVAVKLVEGTDNSLSDAAGGTHKGALYCKGHLEFKGKGNLQISGNTAHGIFAKEYIELKNSNITINTSVKDGINCNQYFAMESGSLSILKSGDDGIQVSYKDTENREAEDTGSITITGGTINISTSAVATKCIKADNEVNIAGGTLTLSAAGIGTYDTADSKTKAAACIGADGNVNISGGTTSLTATGGGGKGISCDGSMNMSDGTLRIKTSGGMLVYSSGTLNQNYTSNADRITSNNKSSAKGIKADKDITIAGGDIIVVTSGNGAEGIESKDILTITGGTLNVKAYDDAVNSSSHMYVKGGDITVVSSSNDGLDANGSIYISGGIVRAFGAKSPECGLDANSEEGYTCFFTGGMIFAVGGGNSVPTTTASTQAFISLSSTVTAGSTVTIKNGTNQLATFTVPDFYGTTSTPLDNTRAGGGGWGPGGSSGGGLVISLPEMVSGQSYTVTNGSTTTSATAKTK